MVDDPIKPAPSVADEWLQVVDREGRPIRRERRGLLHRSPEIIHASVSVMVFNRAGELFLQLRADSRPVAPGKWDTSCSGHCSPGEAPEAAARRELREEIGIEPAELVPFWQRISGTAIQTEWVQTYLATHEGPFRLQESEVADGRFWPRDEVLAALGTGTFTPHLEEECLRYFLGSGWPRALALDLDGTVLGPDRQMAPETVKAVRAVRERGVVLLLATARPPRSAREFVETLGVDTPVIYYNGALVQDPRTGKLLHHHPIPADLAGELVQAMQAECPDVHISFEVLDKWYTDAATVDFPTVTAVQFVPDAIGPLESFLRQPITKLLASRPGRDSAALADLVHRRFEGRLQPLLTDGGVLLQVVRHGVGKGAALSELLADVHLTSRDLLAVGDDMNDACMIEMALRGVAMGNAPDALKRLADDVTATNAELGVAKTVEKYILSLPLDGMRGTHFGF